MVDDGDERTPAVISRHLEQVRAAGQIETVYVRPAITSYHRRRLIEHKAPFIVPGNQMYLPTVGIDLHEHLRQLRTRKRLFSPCTQALILHALFNRAIDVLVPGTVAGHLGYSAMSMTRAFDELAEAGIGEHSRAGKERNLRFNAAGKTLWEKVLARLSSPLRKSLYVSVSLPAPKAYSAGLSALAYYTRLVEPEVPVVAVSAAEWKSLKEHGRISELGYPEPGTTRVEIWKYSPMLFSSEGIADRLSVYLSLKDSTDERILSACDELLGGMAW